MMISETWLIPAEVSPSFTGYNCLRQDRNIINNGIIYKQGGGLAIYYKEGYIVQPQEDLCIKHDDLELLTVTAKAGNSKKTFLVSVYRPPSGTSFANFLVLLEAFLKKLDLRHNFIISGDFNSNFLKFYQPNTHLDNPNPNTNTTDGQETSGYNTKLKTLMESFCFSQLIRSVTRDVGTSATLIDLIFVNNINKHNYSGVINHRISDHYITYIISRNNKIKKTKSTITGRSLKRFDEEEFKKHILTIEDNELLIETQDPDTAWDIFFNHIVNYLDTYHPITEITLKCNDCPRVTREVIDLFQQKQMAYKKASKSRLAIDWSAAHKINKKLKALTKNSKALYLKEKLNLHYSDPRKYWPIVRQIIPDTKKAQNKITQINDSGNPAETLQGSQAANHMANFFTTIGQDINNSCKPGPSPIFDNIDPEPHLGNKDISLKIPPITLRKTWELIKAIRTYKPSGCSQINRTVYKLPSMHIQNF